MKFFPDMRTKLATFILSTFIVFVATQQARALEIDLGVQVAGDSFSVYSEDDPANAQDNKLGEMIQQGQISPILGLSSKNRYLGETYFGWSIEAAYRRFSAKEQWLDATDEAKDLGTRMSGYAVYVTPHVFYQFSGSKKLENGFYLAAGYGVSYAKARGDLILTGTTGAREQLTSQGFGHSVGWFARYQTEGRWYFDLYEMWENGPYRVKDKNYSMYHWEAGLRMGKKFKVW